MSGRDRSKVNGDNSRIDGLSQTWAYDIWRGLYRRGEPVCPEWAEGWGPGRRPRPGLVRMYGDLMATIGPRPSKQHKLIIKRGSDNPVWCKGNVEWWDTRVDRSCRCLLALVSCWCQVCTGATPRVEG